jgi:CyaY protein
MSESEFLARAEAALAAIESALDAADLDVEPSRAGNVLTLELADGSKIVINTQAPMEQIWVAAKSGAFHYAWREGEWRDTRDGSELFAALSRLLSALGGQLVVLRPHTGN